MLLRLAVQSRNKQIYDPWNASPCRSNGSFRRHQFLFDLYRAEEDDFALKRACDQARLFGLLKQPHHTAPAFVVQDSDDGPESDLSCQHRPGEKRRTC